jgi:hypothetical protein
MGGSGWAKTSGDQNNDDLSQATLNRGVEIPKKGRHGPTVYIVDIFGNLATLDLSTKRLTIVGNSGTPISDLAFAPDGTLYGITFTDFYKIDPETGAATLVGHTGASGLVGLRFDSRGRAFAASASQPTLYHINPSTGVATAIGSMAPFVAEGGLVFFNDHLLLSGTNVPDASKTFLVTLDLQTGAPLEAVRIGLRDLYGLASTGKHELYGFAHKNLYRLFPNRTSDRDQLLSNLARTGIGQIVGAAYDGNFQP